MKIIFSFRKLILFSILLTLINSNVSAQLLVENFDYPQGSILSTYIPSTGWTVVATTTTTPIDVTTGLIFPGYSGSGIGGAANIDNTGEDDYKLFTAQTTGTVYAAFIIKTQATNSAGYFFSFTSNSFSTSSYACRVYVNATGTGVGIGPNVPTIYQPITPETPTLLVVKYNMQTKVSSLFVLNSFQFTEPLNANATATETVTTNVGGILLRQYNASQRIIIDGIRVGNTWSEAVAANCTASNLSFATTTINKTVGDASFIQTASSLNAANAITYTSSAPSVASVDISTGAVTLGVAGSATITANQPAGNYNSVDYCAASSTYVVNLTNPPSLTVTEVLFPDMSTSIGNPTTETFNISGVNLTADISISISGADANLFTTTTNSIVQSGGVGSNTVITVTYLPTSQGLHTATLNLVSAGAENVSQLLKGYATSTSGIENPESLMTITSFRGSILLTAEAGEKVDIYNTMGQKVKSIIAVEGLNTIPVLTKGVVIVIVRNKATKILI